MKLLSLIINYCQLWSSLKVEGLNHFYKNCRLSIPLILFLLKHKIRRYG